MLATRPNKVMADGYAYGFGECVEAEGYAKWLVLKQNLPLLQP